MRATDRAPQRTRIADIHPFVTTTTPPAAASNPSSQSPSGSPRPRSAGPSKHRMRLYLSQHLLRATFHHGHCSSYFCGPTAWTLDQVDSLTDASGFPFGEHSLRQATKRGPEARITTVVIAHVVRHLTS